MSWRLYRWIWRLASPLYVGATPAGSVNRCRLYIPARALWGAITAELARRHASDFPAYGEIGQSLRDKTRFTYLYPAEHDSGRWYAWLPRFEKGYGLVWRPEDCRESSYDLSDREMRQRLLSTRPGTAINPSTDTAEEGSMRETECINIWWRKEDATPGSPVAMVGYLFLREDELKENIEQITEVTIGGDTRYGLGKLRRCGGLGRASRVFGHAIVLDDQEPAVKTDVLLAHAVAQQEIIHIRGQLEAVVAWDYGTLSKPHDNNVLWAPGTVWCEQEWIVSKNGYWERN